MRNCEWQPVGLLVVSDIFFSVTRSGIMSVARNDQEHSLNFKKFSCIKPFAGVARTQSSWLIRSPVDYTELKDLVFLRIWCFWEQFFNAWYIDILQFFCQFYQWGQFL